MKRAFGTQRTVFLVGRWAIKVPVFVEWRLFLLGLLANMQEARFSAAGFPGLCPVLFAVPGGFLNVMRRAEPLSRHEFFLLDVASWRLRGDHEIPVEDKMDSFGVLDGRIVAVDYGS